MLLHRIVLLLFLLFSNLIIAMGTSLGGTALVADFATTVVEAVTASLDFSERNASTRPPYFECYRAGLLVIVNNVYSIIRNKKPTTCGRTDMDGWMDGRIGCYKHCMYKLLLSGKYCRYDCWIIHRCKQIY